MTGRELYFRLLTYVKPHVQEDPLAQVLGIAYLGAALEQENIPNDSPRCRSRPATVRS